MRYGSIEKFLWRSQVFPGTERSVHVSLPPGHTRASDPVRFMVFQDGWGYANPEGEVRAPTVFANLLASGELPPMVGIFVDPGTIPAAAGGQAVANRQFEYDSISEQYVRLLTEEVLPQVQRYANLQSPRRGCGDLRLQLRGASPPSSRPGTVPIASPRW